MTIPSHPALTDAELRLLIASLFNRREMVNHGHGNVNDIPDADAWLAATCLASLSAQVGALRKALEPFQSGGWGAWLAWLVIGAPSREEGVLAAGQIVRWQTAVDAALNAAPAPGHPAKREKALEPSFSTAWERDDYEREKRGATPLGPLGIRALSRPKEG